MKTIKPRLMLDADGVLVDMTTPILNFLRTVGKYKTYDQVTGWDNFDGDVDLEKEFKQTIASKPGFCYGLKPLPGAHEFVRAARDKYDIAIVTSPYNVPPWYNERTAWLVDNLGVDRHNITFTHQKEFVDGDVLVEDKIENIFKWYDHWKWKAKTDGFTAPLPVVMDQPWNRIELPTGMVRAVGFEELSKRLEEFGFPRVL